MAEMKCLVSSLYRGYTTALCPEMDGYAPGVTTGFEVFYDETVSNVKVRTLALVKDTAFTRDRNMSAS